MGRQRLRRWVLLCLAVLATAGLLGGVLPAIAQALDTSSVTSGTVASVDTSGSPSASVDVGTASGTSGSAGAPVDTSTSSGTSGSAGASVDTSVSTGGSTSGSTDSDTGSTE